MRLCLPLFQSDFLTEMNKEIEKYLLELEAKGYSRDLRKSSERALNGLQLYLQEAFFLKSWTQIEETHLNSYLVHLSKYTEQKNSSLRQAVSRIRRFFKGLDQDVRRGIMKGNQSLFD